ncbi:MAG: hypothetical protein ACRBBP_03105 [Bdellovibrionales bacterium]
MKVVILLSAVVFFLTACSSKNEIFIDQLDGAKERLFYPKIDMHNHHKEQVNVLNCQLNLGREEAVLYRLDLYKNAVDDIQQALFRGEAFTRGYEAVFIRGAVGGKSDPTKTIAWSWPANISVSLSGLVTFKVPRNDWSDEHMIPYDLEFKELGGVYTLVKKNYVETRVYSEDLFCESRNYL